MKQHCQNIVLFTLKCEILESFALKSDHKCEIWVILFGGEL